DRGARRHRKLRLHHRRTARVQRQRRRDGHNRHQPERLRAHPMDEALDPISFAVVRNALDALIDEVAYTAVRTPRSEIVQDVRAYSAALCDAEGRMVVQAKTIALHLGAVPEAMQEVLARYDNDLRPGDAVVLNDPYQGGMHLPDIFMFYPIFVDGRR